LCKDAVKLFFPFLLLRDLVRCSGFGALALLLLLLQTPYWQVNLATVVDIAARYQEQLRAIAESRPTAETLYDQIAGGASYQRS
jgi:hypothetical protein